MTWTIDKPSSSGWYWYREPGFNMDKPCPAWVFDSHQLIYVSLMAVHSEPVVKNVNDSSGEWSGPMEVPTRGPMSNFQNE